ncbi:hypothetical protein CEUSTIGMA_g8619.t1 [Chlamydomonas eustigma]|uniref:peptidylprolyl isomerase n=1 Tax=Chlamydomonas eustigma TaxID=1157962 RepID=A0A250XDQ2_9CHLO|nr:hypothetical protein CEUSTIGMA_g8619.t1 [Chlamydomonas eustigma]|eukprot:GAX81186.1 hypothetical protein CEUSTIGMA_g8619.t1 [Chlamydomonas eustigma]
MRLHSYKSCRAQAVRAEALAVSACFPTTIAKHRVQKLSNGIQKCSMPTLQTCMRAHQRPSIHSHRRLVTVAAAAAAAADSNIKVEKTEVSPTIRRLSITVPSDMTQECFKTTVDNLRGVVGNLKGFRKDQIPLSMLITQCGGQRTFKITVIEEIMEKTMEEVIAGVGDPIVPDSVRITSDINDLEANFDPAKPFKLEFEYETVPPIVWKRPYREVEVTIKDNGDLNTDNEAVEDLIRQFRKQKGFQRVVVGRGLQRGDTCIMDIDILSKESKAPFPGMCKSKITFDTEVDPLDLHKEMAGMVNGEERTFSLTFPADYNVELWRGMEAEVTIKLRELFQWVLPEFDDTFVKTNFVSEFESAEDMRKGLLATTAMERVKDLDQQLEDQVMDAVVSCIDIAEVPEKLVLEMGNNNYRNNLYYMMKKGMASQEDLEKLLTEDLVNGYIEKHRKDLQDMVTFNIAVDNIFEAEGLQLQDEDIEAEMELQKKQYQSQKMEYDAESLRSQVIDSMKHVTVIEWLKDNLKRNVIPYTSPTDASATPGN